MRKIGKIVCDKAIPFLESVFEDYFEVVYKPGADISRDDVKDALALVIRTRTKCKSALLEGSSVRLIATATIGTDHIDRKWCEAQGIKVVSAPGCNSGGVCQYVFSALSALNLHAPAVLGVVGVGHVGSKVVAKGRELGYEVLENDPPRGLPMSLDELLQRSDIVTVHIPLEGNRDFIDSNFIAKMKKGACLINASRGEVMDDEAFLSLRHKLGPVVLDVWRNEPDINPSMIEAASIATPHIAGYSIQGKINGTKAAVRAVGEMFGVEALKKFDICVDMSSAQPYNIMKDDKELRSCPSLFEQLRNNYDYRDETQYPSF